MLKDVKRFHNERPNIKRSKKNGRKLKKPWLAKRPFVSFGLYHFRPIFFSAFWTIDPMLRYHKIFPVSRTMEKYESQVCAMFCSAMAVVKSWFLRIWYTFDLLCRNWKVRKTKLIEGWKLVNVSLFSDFTQD